MLFAEPIEKPTRKCPAWRSRQTLHGAKSAPASDCHEHNLKSSELQGPWRVWRVNGLFRLNDGEQARQSSSNLHPSSGKQEAAGNCIFSRLLKCARPMQRKNTLTTDRP